MKVFNINNFKDWFIGDFFPTLLPTKHFEIGYKQFKRNSLHPKHLHKIATEYNLITKGRIKVNGRTIKKGEIFVIAPNEITETEFPVDVDIVSIKVPFSKGDKYVISD